MRLILMLGFCFSNRSIALLKNSSSPDPERSSAGTGSLEAAGAGLAAGAAWPVGGVLGASAPHAAVNAPTPRSAAPDLRNTRRLIGAMSYLLHCAPRTGSYGSRIVQLPTGLGH